MGAMLRNARLAEDRRLVANALSGKAMPNKSLDDSGGDGVRLIPGRCLICIRSVLSTQPFSISEDP